MPINIRKNLKTDFPSANHLGITIASRNNPQKPHLYMLLPVYAETLGNTGIGEKCNYRNLEARKILLAQLHFCLLTVSFPQYFWFFPFYSNWDHFLVRVTSCLFVFRNLKKTRKSLAREVWQLKSWASFPNSSSTSQNIWQSCSLLPFLLRSY